MRCIRSVRVSTDVTLKESVHETSRDTLRSFIPTAISSSLVKHSSHVPDPIAFYFRSMAKQRKVISRQKRWLGKVSGKPLDLHFVACGISKAARRTFRDEESAVHSAGSISRFRASPMYGATSGSGRRLGRYDVTRIIVAATSKSRVKLFNPRVSSRESADRMKSDDLLCDDPRGFSSPISAKVQNPQLLAAVIGCSARFGVSRGQHAIVRKRMVQPAFRSRGLSGHQTRTQYRYEGEVKRDRPVDRSRARSSPI